tara:strand:+ start:48 stop:299 length:252 start_codon:yes stop_codon:yes gene_type:complete
MQIVSNCGQIVIDYYPTKSWITNKLIPDLNLKVVSNGGKTQYKVLMNDYATGNDILDKNDSGLFNITDNTKGYPQFVNNSEVN